MNIILIDKFQSFFYFGQGNFEFQIGKGLFHEILTKTSGRK